MEPKHVIFLSVGTPDSGAQEEFISAVEAHLKSHNCVPQTVGRSKHSLRQPVQAARDTIGECNGAIVIAFERTRILNGLEKPGSNNPKEIRDESHPTIWNQMESAMAYAQRVPILTLVQTGLKRQGMLSDRLEWIAIETNLSPAVLRTEQFQQVFDEWLALVKQSSSHAEGTDFDPSALKVGALFSQLTTKQLWGLFVVVAGVLVSVSTAAFKLGQTFPPDAKSIAATPPASQSPSPASSVKP